MKTSYRLIGTFWDQKPLPKCFPDIFSFETLPADSVRLSYILKLKDEEIESMKLSGIYKYLYIDYLPVCRYMIFQNFYSKRLLQIADYLNLKLAYGSDTSKEEIVNILSTVFAVRE